ncbi:tripartite tricarboxylate transporter TctB family protein [Phaeovulum sp. W22_SRMD_FR3]|uniref:tripartite tricarboxylate transporter TctB family protein n=1 Tax=Phaeovulum sp. W22_SRMD_FR3 TaxID=3240274 RepID=UPI003F970B77
MWTPPRSLLATDTLAGIGVFTISIAFCIGAAALDLGSLARMQEGFFPLMTGGIGALLGIALVISGLLSTPDRVIRPALRPLLFIGAAFVVFSLLIDRAGLIAAIIACGTISALANPKTRLTEALLLSAGLALGIWLLFVQLLDMPITVIAGL